MAALETRDYVLRIEPDVDTENPLTSCDGMWNVYTWRHKGNSIITDTSIEQFFPRSETGAYTPTLALRNKLRAGTAFLIDYYSYLPRYTVADDGSDPHAADGIIVWKSPVADMGAKSRDERKKDAAICLHEYSEWAGGNCFWYSLEDADTGDLLDSCGGLIGTEWAAEAVSFYGNLAERGPIRVKIVGTAADIAEMYREKFPPNVTFVTAFSDDGADEEMDEY